MSWTLLLGTLLALGVLLLARLVRLRELARMQQSVRARDRALRSGAAEAQLQHPVVDLSRCLGCATCFAVCPEEGVLDIVHGQAVVQNGARCQGVSACERECPVGAITVTLARVEERTDIPAVTEELEAVGVPGLFLAGEVTAHALVKTAVDHGVAVAAEVAHRTRERARPPGDVLDLVVVGAGPAGLGCSLEAKRVGLRFVTLDQELDVGGTVAKYPRRKLVLTQPLDLPLHGRLGRRAYTKEELIDLWRSVAAEAELPIRAGEVFHGLRRDAAGNFVVQASGGEYVARHVCLALGRRGVPRKLGVAGEALPKVAHALLDARSYQERRLVVVGGGDSAVETALALAEQPGNDVTLAHRREEFVRIRARNQERLRDALARGALRVRTNSEVREIRPDAVRLVTRDALGEREQLVPNDEVFVMIGGTPPVELLERAGVSFDPSERAGAEPIEERGTGLTRALASAFAFTLAATLWAAWHADYYALPLEQRPAHAKHAFLRPSQGAGLAFGISAVALIVVNLAYLLRRAGRVRFGSLTTWMTSHVATGVLALLCALLHGAMTPRSTVGGDAFWALALLLGTGAIGRYLYAWVPRAANGRELELEEVRAQLGQLSEELDGGQRAFRERVRGELFARIEERQWRSSFLGRVRALLGGQREMRRALASLEAEGRALGVAPAHIAQTLRLARGAHRSAVMAAHFEDLRGVLGTWRYLHRWLAVLMLLLVLLHVGYAVVYR